MAKEERYEGGNGREAEASLAGERERDVEETTEQERTRNLQSTRPTGEETSVRPFSAQWALWVSSPLFPLWWELHSFFLFFLKEKRLSSKET